MDIDIFHPSAKLDCIVDLVAQSEAKPIAGVIADNIHVLADGCHAGGQVGIVADWRMVADSKPEAVHIDIAES